MDEEVVDLGRVISSNVQLKHLEALWNILTDMTVVDPFASVSRSVVTGQGSGWRGGVEFGV